MIKSNEKSIQTGLEIAVIGMAGRFPGARNVEEFWHNLKNGIESFSFYSDKELESVGIEPELLKNPDFVKTTGGVLEQADCFDSAFFGYIPVEAEIMDPQLRIFHECSWQALEDAGYNPGSYHGSIGLYAGASHHLEWETAAILSGKSKMLGDFNAGSLTNKDFLCTRVSYKLNLKGPAVEVQTACSTSLVAIHLACRALLTKECDMALAGGVRINLPRQSGYLYQEGMIASSDGHCRAFDAKASGAAGGNGAAVVVLKKLSEAVKDRDNIYAVIKGSAINNDGVSKAGFSAPSIEGQANVIKTAQHIARVEPGSISYIEAHGTGTIIGDPIEVEALKLAFNTKKTRFCAVGSVKTNIGHLDAAAGVASLIKTVLVLKHQLIPPSLNFETPNPKIDFKNSPFYVNTTLTEWKQNGYPFRAGVSSFGIGGTNAHVVLEQAPATSGSVNQWVSESVGQYVSDSVGQSGNGQGTVGRGGSLCPPSETRSHQYQLILLSARTPSALDIMTENLIEYFKKNPDVNLADAAYTLQVGREFFEYRKVAVCSSLNDAIETLSSSHANKVQTFHTKEKNRSIVFMFPGQGSQYVNMGLRLYQTEPLFREAMDHCFNILKPLMGYDIKEILYPHSDCRGKSPCPPQDCVKSPGQVDHSPLERGTPDPRKGGGVSKINQTEITQPLLVAFEYALAQLLMKWGIKPQVMIGHSIGEYTAACLSGVFSLADALKVVTLRGQLIRKISPGSMLSVPLPEEQLKPLLTRKISLAAVNSPSHCVVSGTHQSINQFQNYLKKRGYESRHLHTSHAFHSDMIEPIVEEFEEKLKQVKLNKPGIPFVSNVTGQRIQPAEAVNPGYWSGHLRETVYFGKGLHQLLKDKDAVFIELGPGNVLSTFVRQHQDQLTDPFDPLVVNILRHPNEDVADDNFLLSKIGQLWLYGIKPGWSEFYCHEKRNRLPLPTYPFEQQRYRIKTGVNLYKNAMETLSKKPSLKTKTKTGKREMSEWFYIPSWKRTGFTVYKNDDMKVCPNPMVFIDDSNIGSQLVKAFEKQGQHVTIVKPGTGFTKESQRAYRINPREDRDYGLLFEELREKNLIPGTIIHLWSITAADPGELKLKRVKKAQVLGFYSLVHIARAIEKLVVADEIQIMVVSNNMQEVTGEEELCPGKATLLGPIKVITQEYPNISCKSIDIVLSKPGIKKRKNEKLIQRLLAELGRESTDRIVAYRGNHRWVQVFEPIPLEKSTGKTSRLKEKGIYLIIGGLGNIGLILAEYLTRSVRARLILTGRSSFPARKSWEKWLDTHDDEDRISRKILKIRELEDSGAEVLVFNSDAANKKKMQKMIDRVETQFGSLDGVIHSAAMTKNNLKTISDVGKNICEEQFKSKIYTLLVLKDILKDKNIDFCLLMSSLSSVLGGLGFAAYSSANLFMDAFVCHYRQSNHPSWLSINWEGWKFNDIKKPPAVKTTLDELAITPEEGIKVFEHIFSLNWNEVNQLIISTGDLQDRLNKWIKLESLSIEDNSHQQETSLLQFRPRPNLTRSYAAPGSVLEEKLVSIWQNFFGFQKIGVEDDFFELGGDSLKAVTIAAHIHKELNVKIPLAEMFRTPTIKGLSQYIRGLGQDQFVSLEVAEEKEYYLLSSAQKRLYILQHMDLESTSYNMPIVIPLNMEIDKDSLEKAIKKVIERHESLRTSFLIINEKPVQKVHHCNHIRFAIDCVKISKSQEEDTLKNFVRPFDLSQAPLLRVCLIEVESSRRVLLIDMHHIITDGISQGILKNELITLYLQEEWEPPRLRIQYKDYSQWQNCKKQKELIKQQELYWTKAFSDELPVLNLPTDYPRPVMQRFEGSTVEFVLNKRETRSLKKITQEQDATLYMAILSVFTILLSKLSGQEDIIVGTPIAARRHADLEKIIGMFLNTLTMRNYPSGQKPFSHYLNEVKAQALRAYENQEYQFEDLVDKISVSRDTSRNPLFDVMFNMLNIFEDTGNIPNIPGISAGREYQHREGISKFDMNLRAALQGEILHFSLDYSILLFKKETIVRIISYFKNIINSVIVNPDQKISGIRIIADADKAEQLLHFNQDLEDKSQTHPIQDQLFNRFKRYSNHIAIEYGTLKITYDELERKAAYISDWMMRNQIKTGSFIGIYVRDRAELIALMMGILKARSVFVPLDSRLPIKRTTAMIRLTNTQIIFTDTINIKKLQQVGQDFKNNLTIVIIDDSFYKTNPSLRSRKEEMQYDAEDMVYIYFTSGTTGTPRAILGKNKGLLHFINWEIDTFAVDETFKFSQLINPGFDVFLRDIFIPLCAGAAICIPKNSEILFDTERIAQWIETRGINLIHFVPSLFRVLLSSNIKANRFKSLRYITLSGEQIHIPDLKRWYEIHGETVQLVNIYGPTETTLAKAYYFIKKSDIHRQRIPIGQPIEGSKFILLDRYRNMCGQGIMGEIYIRTPYRSFGYSNDPELNKKQFILNPFNLKHDGIDFIYKTGDLARELSDGNFELIGRIDRQVKIRGIRIELEEIESVLMSHQEIREAALVAKEEKGGDIYLCAYLVSDSELSVSELRGYLARYLPDYMIPAYFVRIDKIPLTPNGKINRQALPLPKPGTTPEDYAPPQNKLEKKLVGIWSEVLNIVEIGINDNFFELGGHSLKATVLMSKIHKALNVKVPLAEIFRIPTIRGLAEYIEGLTEEKYASIEPVEKKDYYELSSAQKRMYILQQMDLNGTVYHITQIIPLLVQPDPQRMEWSINRLIQRHESLRTSFEIINNQPVQKIHDEVEFKIEYYIAERKAQSAWHLEPGSERQTQSIAVNKERCAPSAVRYSSTIKNFVRPFDLSQAPLLRVGVIREQEGNSPGKQILMVDMHHIISDGISLGILAENLISIYTGTALLTLRIQYKDFSEWQNSEGEKENIRQQETYWLKEFEQEVPLLNIPTDYSRPEIRSFEGNSSNFRINGRHTDVLKKIALKENATLYMVVLAVYNILLSKLSGQEEVVVGAPIAGRRHADLEPVIGMFVNTLVLRNYPNPGNSFREFLNHLKIKTLQAFENQDYQFEDLVEKVAVNRDTGRNPLFDAVYMLYNIGDDPAGTSRTPGTITALPHHPPETGTPRVDQQQQGFNGDNTTSKFDITLIAVERPASLYVTIQYSTKLFKQETIERFISHFKNIVSLIVKEPAVKLSGIEIISQEERKRLLFEINDTKTVYPKDKAINQLFEEQVERTPDNIAVVGAHQLHERASVEGTGGHAPLSVLISVTYKKLNEKSNQLAHLMRAKGVKFDTIVGIMVERSIGMIVGILGILKAGGAYLPIDPRYPGNRIISMLEEGGVSVLLTETPGIGELSFTALQGLEAINEPLQVTGPRAQVKDFDDLPIPDRSMINYEKYSQYIGQGMVKNSITLQATRGCPYNCAYCCRVWPKTYVTRSAENIFAELQLYYNLGIRRFVFIDDIFNLNIQNSSKFFQLIIDNGLKVQLLFPSGLRGDILTREYIDLMVRAGTISFPLALETASHRLQKLIRKNLNIEKLRENMVYIIENHPQVILELHTMHGFPTETEEEAMKTLDFIKSLKWIHFPYIHILKIYSNTLMKRLAIEKGIPADAIARSENLAYHQLPETLPFDKSVTLQYQTYFLNHYFLSKTRLLHVLPYQVKILTEDEIVQKYNSYLPIDIHSLKDLLEFLGITREQLGVDGCVDEDILRVPELKRKIKAYFPAKEPSAQALRVLLLDLSHLFSPGTRELYDVKEQPLGLMYLMAYLKQQWGSQISGKIAKSRIEFDSYAELKMLIEEFQPEVIGIRTLTIYKDFFHQTAAMIRQWGIRCPIIAGGPYATSGYQTLLKDRNIDLAVLGEGEITFSEIIEKILENNGKLPGEEILKEVKGIAFIPKTGTGRPPVKFASEVVMMEAIEGVLARQPRDNPASETVKTSANLAYVMFTSGSTGQPKGVLTTHYNVTRLVRKTNYIDLTSRDRVLQLSNYAFDGSVFDIYGALLNGSALVLLSARGAAAVDQIAGIIEKESITVFFVTTALFNLLVDESSGIFHHIKKVLFGGERVSVEHTRQALEYAGKHKIIHVYGPTESTVYATYYFVEKIAENVGTIPIGKPLSNTTVYILDKYLNPVPIGVMGEMYIGGDSLARGYLNSPELTAEKFKRAVNSHSSLVISSSKKLSKSTNDRCPMSNDSSHKLYTNDRSHSHHSATPPLHHSPIYRTGDIARWLPDGNIEFSGRMDTQLKLRGFRIEMGEIENQLQKKEEIKEAVVLAFEDRSEDKYLCAYIVPNSTSTRVFDRTALESSRLKKYLSDSLPDYMIPSYFTVIDQMPLTPNGKIDRRALPSPKPGTRAGDYAAPQNKIEKKLVEIWSEVLHIVKIGIDDNFFELGGHSLKATILTSKVHKEMKVKIPLTEIFKRQTVREQAQYIKGTEVVSCAAIEVVEKKEYYSLSSAQRGLYILQEMDLESTAYNMPQVIPLGQSPGIMKLKKTLRKLIKHHEGLRTSYHMIHKKPVQKIHEEVEFKIEIYDMKEVEVKVEENEGTGGLAPLPLELAARSLQHVTALISSFIRSFDLSRAPLIRVGLINIGETRHLLLVDMHHIITDGVSQEILEKDLFLLNSGEELAHLKLQYKDYVQWQNRQIQSGELKKQEEYWLKRFKGRIPVLDLPTDYPRTTALSKEGRIHFEVHKELTAKIQTLVSKTGSTVFIFLLAVYTILLSKYSNQEDIVVGCPTAGRIHDDLNHIIGMFVNMVAMRNFPASWKTFRQFLEEVKENSIRAFENQGYQFEELIGKLELPRYLHRNPLTDAVFVMENFGSRANRPKHQDNRFPANINAKFDITLSLEQVEEVILMEFDYRKNLFEEETIKLKTRHLLNIIEEVIENPGIKISRINMLDRAEREELKNILLNKPKESQNNITTLAPVEPSKSKIETDFDF